MKVDIEITFSKEEVLAMCLDRCQRIETAVAGKFEAHAGPYYSGSVVCTFVPRDEDIDDGTVPAVPGSVTVLPMEIGGVSEDV